MAEIFGAVSASITLLESALKLLKRLRKAQMSQKNLPCVLIRHEDELDSINTILQQLKEEENADLHTASLITELARMKQVQRRLAALLKVLELEPTSKKYKEIWRYFLQGSEDEKKLSTMMEELAQIKASMLLCISMANVGVMRDMNKQIVADAAKIERIDSNLRQHLEQLDEYQGLRIAQLLKDRYPSSHGKVLLTQADLQSLVRPSYDSDAAETLIDSDSDVDSPRTDHHLSVERIIMNNMAMDQSVQFNTPVGEDIWKDIKKLVIRDNVSKDQAAQFNYPMTLEAAKAMMGAHGENMRLANGTRRRRRRDSALGRGMDSASSEDA